jgi:hypothetical protein
MYNVILSRVRFTTVDVDKQQVLYIMCVCVCVCVALVDQHAMHMLCMILSSVSCLILRISFLHSIIKGKIFGEKFEQQKRFPWFSLHVCLKNLSF